MKNKNIKIIALLAIAAIGIYALNRSKKPISKQDNLTIKESNKIEDLLASASFEKPFTFSKKTENSETTMQYSFDGKKYTKQLMGATVRSTPTEISKTEFIEAYNAYLL